MNYKYIDMESYKRKSHFEYFSSLAYPYMGVTVNVDITELLKAVKEKNLPFFFTVCYSVSKAANQVEEFRQRIVNHQIVEYDYCRTSHTVALNDGTYCYCDLNSSLPFKDYIPYAEQEQERAIKKHSIAEDEEDILDKIFVSTLPWLSYTALINPTPVPTDSNPRITWGNILRRTAKCCSLYPRCAIMHSWTACTFLNSMTCWTINSKP